MTTIETTGELPTVSAEEVPPVVDAFLTRCIDNGMQPPLIVSMTSPDGSVLTFRHRPEASWEILADEAGERRDRYSVVNVMVMDQAGETAQLRLMAEGVLKEERLPESRNWH